MRYVFSVVRFVPDPATGEFVNIGAIAGSDETGDWSSRLAGNPRRARGFGPPETLNAVFAFMTEIGSKIDDHVLALAGDRGGATDEVSEEWLADLHRRHRYTVQLTSPAPVVADSAEDALGYVFGRIVKDDVSESIPREYAGRSRLFSELRTSYLKAEISRGLIHEKSCVVANGHQTNMDFVIGNGVAVQLAHTWSFQIQTISEVGRDVKSWAYTLERLRQYGGHTDGDHPSEIDANVPVEVVYAPPRTERQEIVFEEAKRVFDDLEVVAVPRERVTSVSDEARERLSAVGLRHGQGGSEFPG